MNQQVGDFMLSRLCEWGVDRIYGYPGPRGLAVGEVELELDLRIGVARVQETQRLVAGQCRFGAVAPARQVAFRDRPHAPADAGAGMYGAHRDRRPTVTPGA